MYKKVHKSLLNWYQKNGRHELPWRLTNDPYKVYVSEIMLQQTQVKTVLERFYFPFLEAFPTMEDLAFASLDDVLKKWEGLGYYTRARNLHAAACLCGGKLPKTAQELMDLPGIGRSTAHAIAAFAYREAVPILDANVKRILHRYYALPERDEKQLWAYAYDLFDSQHPFEYNQAMMDLGSLVCVGKQPHCDVCPLVLGCAGSSDPLLYPMPKPKKTKPIRIRDIILFEREGQFALAQRSERFLSGLWGFAQYDQGSWEHTSRYLGHITQHYTHFTLEANVYHDTFNDPKEGFEWFSFEEICHLSLSAADHKVVQWITQKHLI
jgi:A/G-specific adenine glycosylase